MKLFKYILLTIAINTTVPLAINCSDSTIRFFIREEIQNQKKEDARDDQDFISKPLSQPSFVRGIIQDQPLMKSSGVDGIVATYLGYFTISDKNGEIAFPRKQQTDIMHILVTPEILPVFMIEPSVIHHWEIKKDQPVALYQIARKVYKEFIPGFGKFKAYYFDIEKIDVPKNNVIPFNTITLYAHPNDIIIPTEPLKNYYSTDFMLPEITAKKDSITKNSLYTLSIKQYFEQIDIENQKNIMNMAAIIANH